MDKLRMQTANKADENFRKLAELFPNAVTETITGYDEDGKAIIERAIDKDVLMQEISCTVVDGKDERYQFTWPDKKKSILLANAPINKTLRPCREESVGKDGTPGGFDSENLYIEGDNLEVLKLLQETYLDKIKMIYIDPPYNTGNDFVYEDDFAQSTEEYLGNSGQFDEAGNRLVQNTESNGRFHTDWLNMIYSRLHLAKDLLAPDGVIAISIGYQEVHNLVVLCQQLFSNRQVMAITVQTSGGKPNGCFSITNEYLIMVAPTNFMAIPTEEDMKSYASPYHGMNLASFNQVERPNQAYPIFINEKGCIVGCGKSLQERVNEGSYTGDLRDFVFDFAEAPNGTTAVWPITNKNEQCVWRLIPSRLLDNWKKGYVKVVPQNDKLNPNKYAVQFLSGGIIEKIQSGELDTYNISDDVDIPTLEVRDYKTAGSGISTVWTDKEYYTAKGGTQIKELFEQKCFSYPKPLALIKYIIKRITYSDSFVLDFFSGSATTAHAVMKLNAEDGGKRKFIMVQLPEETDAKSEAYKAGYKNICEIGKERIRRAGRKIKEESPLTTQNLDIGFRVLKCDSSNMKDVYYTPDEVEQNLFENLADNIKDDRTPEDLLFQVMLDLGVALSSKIEEVEIAGKRVFTVADGFLMACFDSDVTEDTIKAVAQQKPYYFVMRDSSMANDSVATNFDQIFAAYSPDTVRKVL